MPFRFLWENTFGVKDLTRLNQIVLNGGITLTVLSYSFVGNRVIIMKIIVLTNYFAQCPISSSASSAVI